MTDELSEHDQAALDAGKQDREKALRGGLEARKESLKEEIKEIEDEIKNVSKNVEEHFKSLNVFGNEPWPHASKGWEQPSQQAQEGGVPAVDETKATGDASVGAPAGGTGAGATSPGEPQVFDADRNVVTEDKGIGSTGESGTETSDTASADDVKAANKERDEKKS